MAGGDEALGEGEADTGIAANEGVGTGHEGHRPRERKGVKSGRQIREKKAPGIEKNLREEAPLVKEPSSSKPSPPQKP
jgi:hypothetical protein